MKKLLLLFLFLISVPMAGQNDCSPFYPSREGQTYTINQYNKKDKLSTITEYTITNVSSGTINLEMKIKDEDGEEIVSGAFVVNCKNGETQLKPEAIIPAGLLEQYKNMEYTVTGNGMTYPETLSVGQTLPDGEIFMKVDAGMMNMSIEITMTDRKVEKMENIRTPAGSFDCYVISYTNELKMGIKKTNFSTQWISEGVGMVKEETRKSNGKLITRSILNKIE